jgi:hypothetical protein
MVRRCGCASTAGGGGARGVATLERQWRWCPGRSGGVARGRGKANEQTGGRTDNATRLGGGGGWDNVLVSWMDGVTRRWCNINPMT